MSDKTLGIVLRATADVQKAVDETRQQMARVAQSANAAAAQNTAAFARSGAAVQESLQNVSAKGRIAFQAIGSASAQAGSTLGPLTTGINSVFAAMAAGGPVMIAVTAAFTALGFILSKVTQRAQEAAQRHKELQQSLERTSTATLKYYDDLSKLQGGLDQTQRRLREYQQQLGDGMVAIFNVTTGQWERISAAAAQVVGDTIDNVNLTHRTIEQIFRETRGAEYYKNAISDINAALRETTDVVTRANLQRELDGLNAELRELQNPAPVAGSLGAIRKAMQDQVVTLGELERKAQVAADFVKSTDIAVRAFGLEQLKEINNQISELGRVAAGIKPESELSGRPRGRRERSEEEDAANARKHAAALQSEWEQALIQQGVDAHVAAEIAKTSSSREQAQERYEEYQREYESFLYVTSSMQAAFATGMESIIDTEMTGKERREAIWNSFKQSAIRQITDVVAKHLWGEMAKRAAMIATGLVQKSTAASGSAAEVTAIIATIGKTVGLIAAKVYSFYAGFGPFGIPLAAATIAAILAAVRAIKFQSGGVVPGSGRGDHVPAMLEPGEFVVNREATGKYRTLLEQINSGQKGSWLIAAKLAAGGIVRRNVATTPAEYAYANRVARTEAQVAQAFASGGASLSPVEQNNVNMTVHLDRDADERDVSRVKHLVDTWVVEAVEAAIDRGAFRRRFAFA